MRCASLLLMLLFWTGCDATEQQRDFADEALRAPNGITETDVEGNIIDEDADDWRVAPFYAGKLDVQPAFPNPTASVVTLIVNIRFSDAVPAGLAVAGLDNTGRFLTLDELSDNSPGVYAFTFNPLTLGRTGLIRVFVLDPSGDIVSYGDIRIVS